MKSRGIAVVGVVLAVAGFFARRALHSSTRPEMTAPVAQPSVSAATASQAPSPQSSSSQHATEAPQRGESIKTLGPFSIAGRDYFVQLHTKNVGGRYASAQGDSVISMEIRDAAGALQYQRTFSFVEATDEEVDIWYVSALLLAGANGKGLLVSYDFYSEPSAPEEESTGWYQVFGVVNGKLAPFGGALEIQGGLLDGDVSSKVYRASRPVGTQADVVEFKMWTGHCRVVYPVRVDWSRGNLAPAQECTKQGGAGSGCQYQVLPEEKLHKEDVTFVRLWPNPSESQDQPEKTVVKADSKVELLTALVATEWTDGRLAGSSSSEAAAAGRGGARSGEGNSPTLIQRNEMEDAGGFGVARDSDLWLKVRIDGKEGWMHSEEDFRALGLPEDE